MLRERMTRAAFFVWILALMGRTLMWTTEMASSQERGLMIFDMATALPPMRPTNGTTPTNIGFVHLGKTSGSTMASMLRNACHSFVNKPCRKVQHETILSERVKGYYHFPDYGLLRKLKDASPNDNTIPRHDAFLMGTRDVYDRAVSAFLYEHYDNLRAHKLKQAYSKKRKVQLKKAYSCFPNLDSFAEALGEPPYHYSYPHPHQLVDNSNCTVLARAAMDGRVSAFNHFYLNYQVVMDSLPPNVDLYVIRQEQFSFDWENVHRMIGHQGPVIINKASRRNVTHVSAPVGKDMSENGRRLFCKALEDEYKAYFEFLKRAVNLGSKDIELARAVGKQRCPELDLD